MAIARRRLTLEEFLELPEEKPALEYIDGEVTQKVSPMQRHSAIQLVLLERINRIGRRRKRALALPELRVTLAGQSRVPDIAVFRWERLVLNPAGELSDVVTIPPDVTIEIVSPGQTSANLSRSAEWFVTKGVKLALVVDGPNRSIHAFRPQQPTQVWQGHDLIDISDLLPDLTLTVERLFKAAWRP